jgi:hypothetical protein
MDEDSASIEIAWYPILETGGVPLTGFKLYSVDINGTVAL